MRTASDRITGRSWGGVRSRVLALIGLATALLASGASAATALEPPHSRLAYLTDLTSVRPTAWVADVDGSGAVRLGTAAFDTAVAPSGGSVALTTPQSAAGASLVVVPLGGGPAADVLTVRTVLHANNSLSQVAWSPDSARIAAVADGRLVVVTLATGAKRVIARGQIQGVSFAPASDRLVYGRASTSSLSARTNVFVANVDGSRNHAITRDGRSLYPLWGPTRIVYTHERLRRFDAPIYQLWLMRGDGGGKRQLTRVRVGKLVSGLTPTAWSADGRRLLAEFGGQDTSEAWTVNPATGRARDLTGKVDNVVGRGLSLDGSTVLVQRGSFEDAAHQSVATIPYGGGRAHVLVRRGGSPSWNR
jgi:hypothetical protein